MNPAECLEGFELEDGWTVGPLVHRPPQSTGGNFSQHYIVTKADGTRAFLKALDFFPAFGGSDFTVDVQRAASFFNYEREMLNICKNRRMDKIVRSLASGEVFVDSSPLGRVAYLIFEAADCDVRAHLDRPPRSNELAWKLRSLHNVSVGLKQLHTADIAHQDLKPSNVLIFEALKTTENSKIGDLGSVSRAGFYSPFDELNWPGDPNYAPPEVRYSFIQADFFRRRVGSDLYLLGSLVSFLFARTTAIGALLHELDNPFWPGVWGGTYAEVLPYLRHAFIQASSDFEFALPIPLRSELVPIYQQLCEPDPTKRGFPGQPINKISLERYISAFDRMARKADLDRYATT
jgi:eukaryotic-like serine/threonine-protein kinase